MRSIGIGGSSILQQVAKEYNDNKEAWVANILAKGSQKKLEMPEPLKKQIDAISNRNYKKVAESASVIGAGITRTGVNGIQPPEFDLLEIAAAFDAEPLVRRSIKRQVNLWFKEGYNIVGENEKYNTYITKRLKQIAFVTGIPTETMMRQIVSSLLKYSNAFLIVVRNEAMSGGIKKRGSGAPIAGLFPVSPLSMYPKYENGKLIQWVRILKDGTKVQEFDVNDVIHFTLDKEEDFLFGKPRLLGVIEDIAALRRMEENIEILVAKFLFPIYLLKVGSQENPAQYYADGTSEIDTLYSLVQSMEQEGMLLGTERHELEVKGAFAEALDSEPYLRHFKTRLYTGLGVSAVDMGEGDTANRSTADNISQNLKDIVIEDQKEFAAQVQMKLFIPFFLEHPDDISALNAFDQVAMTFYNVDLDSRIKYENHLLNRWNNNIDSHDETRTKMGETPMTTGQMKRTRLHLVDIPLAKISKAQTGAAPQATGTGGGAGNKAGKGKGETENKSRPTNQHGTNPGPTKAKSATNEGFDNELIGERLSKVVDRLMICETEEEIFNVIKDRFQSDVEQKHILPIVENAYAASQYKSELRAALVAGFIPISDQYRDED